MAQTKKKRRRKHRGTQAGTIERPGRTGRPSGRPATKAEARTIGREIEVFSIGQVICRPTQKEADDYYQHAIIDNADWGSIDRMMEIKNLTPQTLGEKVFAEKRYYFASRAVGGYPFIGTPDRIADELATLSRSGIRGIAFSMVNYLKEFPFFRDEVLPRLQRMGVRAKN